MISKNITFQYIHDAAYFRLQLDPWITDKRFRNNGGKIYYAVDTDVIKLYSDPSNHKKYARVFAQDSSNTREILAWALGNLIFYALNGTEPLLIIPPHHLEIERVINGIACNAARERDEVIAFLPQLEEAVNKYQRTKKIDPLIQFFKNKPLALINYAMGGVEGVTAELNRITTLLTDVKILHIDRYVDKRDNQDITIPLLQDDIKEEDYDILAELSKSWEQRLKKTKSKSRGKELIADDAEALARLEWINNEWKDKKKRLVIISGDQALHKAARGYIGEYRNNFADMYIRHPMSFLAAPQFLSFVSPEKSGDITGEDKSKNKIIKLGLMKWFDVFLAQYEPSQEGYAEQLRKIIDTTEKNEQNKIANNYLTDKKRKDSLQNLISDWHEFINLIGFSRGFVGNDSHTMIEKIGEKNIDELRQEILEKTETVWERFLQSATEVGFWSTNAFERNVEENSIIQLPLRGIPAPRFTLDPVCEYIKELCLTLQHGPIIKKTKDISFQDINRKDPSGYSAFFLFSLAFGAAGRWGVSRTLAKHALDIADNLSPDKQLPSDLEPITGNEASYILAWSIRHGAKNAEMLREAKGYLDQAVERIVKATGKNKSDIRYDSEYIAIYMTAHFFNIFKGQTFTQKIPSLEECHRLIISLLTLLEENTKEEEYIQRTVKKQLFVYLFSGFILRKYKNKDNVPQQQEMEVINYLTAFKELIEGVGPPVKTCFTKPVYLAACSLLADNSKKQKECQAEAKDIIKERKLYINRCSVMPYDEELYEFLFSLACKSS